MKNSVQFFSKVNLALLWLYCLSCTIAFGQSTASIPVKGTVTSDQGEGLPGVNVIVKGTTNGTTTDVNGSYTLLAPANSTLVISYIGFTTQEVPVNGRSTIDVVMAQDIKTLTEVVVVGYGTQEKKDVTGAIASISAKDISKIPVSGLDQAIQGQIAGVQISSTSGAPGGNTSILVRGVGSISGGNEPLFVIDGFPVSNAGVGNPLNTINPQDIESIEVLKDASATAIYGSRGSNGVVIVTTKRGNTGKAKIELDVYGGFQQAAKTLELMNAQQYAQFIKEGRNNGYLEARPTSNINDPNSARPASFRIPERYQDPSSLSGGTDWQDAIFRNAPIQSYQISATGGTDNVRYSFSGGYFNQQGIVIESGFKRYNARANMDAQLAPKLKVGISLLPSYSLTDEVQAEGHYSGLGMIVSAWSMPPDIPVYREDGSYGNEIPATDGQVPIQNPVKIAKELKMNESQFRLLGNVFAEYQLIKDLSIRVSAGGDANYYKSNYWKPSTLSSSTPISPAVAYNTTTEDINWLNENTINYRKAFGEKHNLDAIAGFTIQKSSSNLTRIDATNFPDDLVENVSGGQVNAGANIIQQWSLLSYLGRLNYQFDNRYLLTATFRTDGSSRFGSRNRWGFFPSTSVGWRVSEEAFMQDVNFISDLKIRASYGLSGNNDIGNYRHIGLLSPANYITGDALVPGLAPSSFTNGNLGWETSKQLDIGLDLGLLNNRIQFTGDYYIRRNTDMLLNVSVPAITGYTNAWINTGEVENKGLELALNTRNLVGAFQWSTNFNITFNRNKVINLGTEGERIFDGAGRGNTHLTQVGKPIGSFYGHVFDGIFLSQQELDNHATQPGATLGDVRFRDVDGNGVINDEDRDFIGNPLPDFFFGFNNRFAFKNFTLDILMNGMSGNDLFFGAGNGITYNFAGVQNNLAIVYENRWISPDNPGDGKTPRIVRGGRNNNFRYSSFYIFDGSFLRIRNISLGYNVPAGITGKAGLQAARIYTTVNNLHTFTSYPGLDPEVSNSDDNLRAAGLDYGGYPLPRTFTVGVNLTF